MRSLFRLAAALMLVAMAQIAQAQYPSKAIRIVVPFPPGGSADAAARALAQQMSLGLGQQVLVDNRPGADGVIASDHVAKSAPDGYTFLFATSSGLSFAPFARKSLPYDVLNDFTPVGRIGTFGLFVFVHESVPARTLADLVALAKAKPGALNYGSANATSLLATMQFNKASGLDMAHVPYKGDAQLVTDLVAGRIQLSFAAGAVLPHAKDGKLRVLATLLPGRSPLVPEAPTFAESGLPRVSVMAWAGLFGPAKLPLEVVERVSRELAAALGRADLREQFGRHAIDVTTSTPDEMGQTLREQLGTWRNAVQAAGIQPD
ncbi:Bug family tripartite tricarboxylate transporter substrate binding protein [Ramlibacter sp.]|uniref:Bug family tripartite tricarboxylate transporter substrate binding protein n=1 Tax=Ramlibacter sp. TaxID=1917967 RepID=UPI003D0A08FF